MLDRDVVLGLVAHLGRRASALVGVAARLRAGFGSAKRLVAPARCRSVACFSASYSTRTSEAAKRAISHSSASTSAIGWPLNMILSS